MTASTECVRRMPWTGTVAQFGGGLGAAAALGATAALRPQSALAGPTALAR